MLLLSFISHHASLVSRDDLGNVKLMRLVLVLLASEQVRDAHHCKAGPMQRWDRCGAGVVQQHDACIAAAHDQGLHMEHPEAGRGKTRMPFVAAGAKPHQRWSARHCSTAWKECGGCKVQCIRGGGALRKSSARYLCSISIVEEQQRLPYGHNKHVCSALDEDAWDLHDAEGGVRRTCMLGGGSACWGLRTHLKGGQRECMLGAAGTPKCWAAGVHVGGLPRRPKKP